MIHGKNIKQIKEIYNKTVEERYNPTQTFNLVYGTYCNVLSHLNKNRNNGFYKDKVKDKIIKKSVDNMGEFW